MGRPTSASSQTTSPSPATTSFSEPRSSALARAEANATRVTAPLILAPAYAPAGWAGAARNGRTDLWKNDASHALYIGQAPDLFQHRRGQRRIEAPERRGLLRSRRETD